MNFAGIDNVAGLANLYKYNGKELQNDLIDFDKQLNWYDYGARFYDPNLGRFHTQDRFAEDFTEWSTYHYANNNPILNIDVNGDYTLVIMNDDGTYKVTGGVLDDDNGIYTQLKDGTFMQIHESITTHSFFDDDGNAVKGAIIDPKSTEGQDFIDEIVEEDPSLIEYMPNATKNQKYDLKKEGIEERAEGMTEGQYMYRGSVAEDGKIGSARDFGNIGAGIVAARNGLDWSVARLGFDGLESIQKGRLAVEGLTTKKAQRVGFNIGLRLRKTDQQKQRLERLKRISESGHTK